MDLHDDTVINVATLLKDQFGASRSYHLRLSAFPLDEEVSAEDLAGDVKLTRLSDEILAAIRVHGRIELLCLRCLRDYEQTFETEFTEEFRVAVDVRRGTDLAAPSDDERFTINENHELDFREPLRQEILVALPMRPTCGDQCPGPDVLESADDGGVDIRFAALTQLLDDETTD